ncbi:tetratricopeptide repeat protein [Geminicoccaceae bacterium 1502E]|nr:tetratricopeptide repeat protein [Geminicoccaceae bacterium 1502E]
MRPALHLALAAAVVAAVAGRPAMGGDGPAVRWAVLTEEGRSALASGELARAELAMRKALDAAQVLAPEDPRRAVALNNVGFVLHARHELHEAAIFYGQALELRERWLGPDDAAVAQSLVNMAELRREQGRAAEAEGLYVRALAIRRDSPLDRAPLAAVLRGLAAVRGEQGRVEEAQANYRAALALADELGKLHPEILAARRELAALLAADGRREEAVELLRAGRADAGEAERMPLLLDEAALLFAGGRSGDAQALAEQAMTLLDNTFPPEPAATATTLAAIARQQRDAGFSEAAEAALAHARGLLEAAGGEARRRGLLDLLSVLAFWRLEEGDGEATDRLLLEALALARDEAEAQPLLQVRARLLQALGRSQEAGLLEAAPVPPATPVRTLPAALLAEPRPRG